MFSEFLGQGVVQPPSVNYTRHMIPILSGFDEASGWIYENNQAGAAEKRPILVQSVSDDRVGRDVRREVYVAGSPQFIHALSLDPRWKLVGETPDLELFEAQTFTPSLLSRPDTTLDHEGFVQGGGYIYDVSIDAKDSATGNLVVKTNYAPVWKATLDESAPLKLANGGWSSRVEHRKIFAGLAKTSSGVVDPPDLQRKGQRTSPRCSASPSSPHFCARVSADGSWCVPSRAALVSIVGTAGVIGAVVSFSGWRSREQTSSASVTEFAAASKGNHAEKIFRSARTTTRAPTASFICFQRRRTRRSTATHHRAAQAHAPPCRIHFAVK